MAPIVSRQDLYWSVAVAVAATQQASVGPAAPSLYSYTHRAREINHRCLSTWDGMRLRFAGRIAPMPCYSLRFRFRQEAFARVSDGTDVGDESRGKVEEILNNVCRLKVLTTRHDLVSHV